MLLKKKLVIGSVLLAVSLPLIASADDIGPGLNVVNKSSQPSTVWINGTTCSTGIKPPTGPGETSNTPWFLVNIGCQGSPDNICSVEFHTTPDCTGAVVGKAQLNLADHSLHIDEGSGSGYDFSPTDQKGNTLVVTITDAQPK